MKENAVNTPLWSSFRYLAVTGCFLVIGHLCASAADLDIYHDGWIDLNKNGKQDIYENPAASVEHRVADLLSQMTMEEKTCQLVTLYGYCRVLEDPLPTEEWYERVWKDGIGNIDEHLNNSIRCVAKGSTREFSYPFGAHVEALNTVQRFFIEETRLGIPADFTNEGIRGLCHDSATLLPAQIGVGSTWNLELVRQIGHMVGREAFALGYSNIYAPILDLPRDPRWGRIVECYSEDPFLTSAYGLEMVRGLQAEGVASTAKHFAVYGIPKGGRDGKARTDPKVAPREMLGMFMEPFRVAIQDGGGMGVMSSYNDWDGIPVSTSSYFLTELLREEYGFTGYVVSDSDAVEYPFTKHRTAETYQEAIAQCLEAGVNIRTNFTKPENFVFPLREAIEAGRIRMDLVDLRVSEVLAYKFKMGLFDAPYRDPELADQVVRNPEHLEVATQATYESLVLLKNDGILPLDRKQIQRILVTGPNANDGEGSISRYGPSNVEVVTVLEGLKALVGAEIEIEYAKGCEIVDPTWPESEILPQPLDATEAALLQEAVEKATSSDLAIVVLGDSERTVGESVSRTSLKLPGRQELLLQEIHKTGVPVILVLINGRPLAVNWADRYVPAILEAWFPGELGGLAIAETLFGDYNPGGKLSVTFPKTVGQIPISFPSKPASNAGQPKRGPNGIGFSRVTGPLYPFGHGLSYTEFELSGLNVSKNKIQAGDSVDVEVTVTNIGERYGSEVVQLYLQDVVSSVTTYDKMLRGFERVNLASGESQVVHFTLKPEHMELLNADMVRVVEPGEFLVMVGNSSVSIHQEERFTVVP